MNNKSDQTASNYGKWWVMAVIGTGILMGALDMSIVNVSLPTLVGQLNTEFGTIQWVILGYVLVITSMVMTAARLADMIQKKKLYIVGLIVFTISSLLCGFSPNVGFLIFSRVLQGLGAVIMQAVGIAIIVEVFPPKERGRAMGIIGSVISVGISIGPAIGGIIIGEVGWRWIFFVNAPIGLIALFIGLKALPSTAPLQPNQRFDMPGAAILLIALVCFSLGMTMGQNHGFGTGVVRVLLVIFVFGVMFFLFVEKKGTHPMVDLTLFKDPRFCLNLLLCFLSFIILGGIFIMPFFLELVKHYPITQIGLLMMATPAFMGIVAPFSGMLSDRFGTRGISIAGLFVITAACFGISTMHADVTVYGYLLRMMPLGIGMGMFQSPNNSAIMGAVPPKRVGVASGLMSLARSLGHITGLPLMGSIFVTIILSVTNQTVLTDIRQVPIDALVAGFTGTYRIAAIIIFIAALLSILGIWFDKKYSSSHQRIAKNSVAD